MKPQIQLQLSYELYNFLKDKAQIQKTTIESIVHQILQEAFKAETQFYANKSYNDLDFIAGTWLQTEYDLFMNKIAKFNEIDNSLWK